MWLVIIIIIILAGIGIYELLGKGEAPVAPSIPNTVSTTTVATTTPENPATAGWQTYSNDKFSYTFKYPRSITFSKDISVYPEEGGNPKNYKAGTEIPVETDDISQTTPGTESSVVITPLYINVAVVDKPDNYTSLKSYVDGIVDQTIEMGQNSAAGVYATSTAYSSNNFSGYKVVVSDGSVIENRDEKYYFERGGYIYSFDVAYSGYYYENKDKDEVARVDTAKTILSSFSFIK